MLSDTMLDGVFLIVIWLTVLCTSGLFIAALIRIGTYIYAQLEKGKNR